MKLEHNIEIREIPEYAKVLKARREELRITQEQIADSLGISSMGLSYYENGKRIPRIDMLEKWAKAIGCKVTMIIKRHLE